MATMTRAPSTSASIASMARSALYGPAPAGFLGWGQRAALESVSRDRGGGFDEDVEAYLERQARSDPDLWIVEVEARDGTHHLDDWLA